MNTLFPIYIKMDQVHTLLVGAGPVGLEKLQAIYFNSPQAKVNVVALDVSQSVEDYVKKNSYAQLVRRSFQEEDLDGVDLVILATNNDVLNERIRQLCKQRNILLNVADKPSLCDFYLGSVVQKGNLKIGISTNGKSPTMAKRLKELFNELLPEEIDDTLELMHTMRNQLKGDFKDKIEVLNTHTKDFINRTVL